MNAPDVSDLQTPQHWKIEKVQSRKYDGGKACKLHSSEFNNSTGVAIPGESHN
jgi:nitrite reductase/ring-hydroxylating ferredoxin subunit